jgi:hypothetical protein
LIRRIGAALNGTESMTGYTRIGRSARAFTLPLTGDINNLG